MSICPLWQRSKYMARPKCPRLIADFPDMIFFKPRGIPLCELVETTLSIDELEAMRLADLEGLYQEIAAARMGISRATFGRIIESAHHKIADALLNGKAIKIEGGVVKMAQKRTFQCSKCEHSWQVPFGSGRPASCPQCGSKNFCRSDAERGRGSGGRRMGCRRQLGGGIAAGKETK
jgi:predicted DNA-binding protein (UPF0251 family)